MSAAIVIESPAPPHAVLAAIREDAREWRESVIPPALRQEQVPDTPEWAGVRDRLRRAAAAG